MPVNTTGAFPPHKMVQAKMSRMNPDLNLLPFDDIRTLVGQMPEFDAKAAKVFASNVPKMGPRVSEVGDWMAGWQAQTRPTMRRPVVALFAASHAVAPELPDGLQISHVMDLVSEVQRRSGPVARVCEHAELGLKVFELAPELPVDDFSRGAAMQESDCAATIAYGMEATTDGCDFLVVRAVAAGEQASITAITAALLGKDSASTELRSAAENEIAGRALKTHKSCLKSPLELLRRLGGREAAALAGAIVAARLQRVPVILDGSLAVCVALLLESLHTGSCAHCMVSCTDMHPDSTRLCEALRRPVLLSGKYDGYDGTSGALAASHVADLMSLFDSAG